MNKLKTVVSLLLLACQALICSANDQAGTYKLTYLVDGKPYHTEHLAAGAAIVPIPYPVKDGYVFTGWRNLPSTMPDRNIETGGSLLLERYSGITPMKEVKVDSVMYKLANMTVEDYRNLRLPSLDELFENARQSALVRAHEYDVDYYSGDIKTAKRQPLSWVRLVGTYSYGNTDLAAILISETTYQVWQQNSSRQKSMFYNIGATISIPLIDIFNTNNKVKQAKSRAEQARAQQESELDLVKERIVSLYCNIIENIANLPEAFEAMVVAKAQYETAENEFINNHLDAQALYQSRSFAKVSKMDFEKVKSELNESLLILEIISCTPIVSSK